jgi:hypothetical protein
MLFDRFVMGFDFLAFFTRKRIFQKADLGDIRRNKIECSSLPVRSYSHFSCSEVHWALTYVSSRQIDRYRFH